MAKGLIHQAGRNSQVSDNLQQSTRAASSPVGPVIAGPLFTLIVRPAWSEYELAVCSYSGLCLHTRTLRRLSILQLLCMWTASQLTYTCVLWSRKTAEPWACCKVANIGDLNHAEVGQYVTQHRDWWIHWRNGLRYTLCQWPSIYYT